MPQIVLSTIEASSSREPLMAMSAGIRAYLGIEFRAPQEVREMTEDIRGWIERASKTE